MQDLINKISELYLRYGIKSITMDDVAREAGISKKTLYLHFKDKKEMVEKVIHHLINEQKCGMEKMYDSPATNAIDKLMRMTGYMTESLKQSNMAMTYDLRKYFPELWDEVIEFKREEVYRYMMDNIETGIAEGLYRKGLNYDIISRIYVSRLEMYQTDLWEPLSKYDIGEIFQTLFIYHIRGIATPAGLEYLDKNIKNWIIRKN
jgi:TetR/AcrR family transcriptional regulator, cholesterol catabolism regulator